MPAVSPSSQLATSLDSIETTIAVGDAYLKFGDLPHALNSYRTAGRQFAALTPTGNSASLVAGVAAVTASTAAGIDEARRLLGQLFALYGSPGAAGLPAPSSGATLALVGAAGALGALALVAATRRKKNHGSMKAMRRRRRNPGSFFHEHPWMTFFLGMGVLKTARVMIRGWQPSPFASLPSSTSTTPALSAKRPAYDASNAIAVMPGGSVTVPVGTSVYLAQPPGGAYWLSPGQVSSNQTVLSGSNGFVAVSPGTATISGSYTDSQGFNATAAASVTVVSAIAGLMRGSRRQGLLGLMP